MLLPSLSVIPLQLFGYYVASLKGCDIDKPRNLAKSVTGGDKQQGISILVRTFAPRVIAIDEIGKSTDAEAIFHAGVCGCSILATIHGSSIEDIQRKPEMEKLFQSELIDRFIVLSILFQIRPDVYYSNRGSKPGVHLPV